MQFEIPSTASANFGNTELGGAGLPSEYEVLRRTFYKTLSYQALGSVFDVTFGAIVGGELVIGGVLALAYAASDLALTYVRYRPSVDSRGL